MFSRMISLAPLKNAVPRWFGKNFFPNQLGVFGNTNHCKTRADQLSQRKVSKVGKNSTSLKSHLFPMTRVLQPQSKMDAYFWCTKVHFFLSYKWNTLQEHYNQVCRVNTSLDLQSLGNIPPLKYTNNSLAHKIINPTPPPPKKQYVFLWTRYHKAVLYWNNFN